MRPAGNLADRPIALFPLVNFSGAPAPMKELRAALEAALRGHQVELVGGAELESFLARHRIRYTGGVDAASAELAGDELGAAGALIVSIDLYQPTFPFKMAMSMRLVSADREADILWIDAAARAGDDAPGLFDLGLSKSMEEPQAETLGRLAASLAAYLAGKGPSAPACDGAGRFAPHSSFHSPRLDPARTYSVAVLPFVNETQRRSAGELVSLEFLRQLQATKAFHPVEPGRVRDELLRFRVLVEGGVSLDKARILLELLQADLIVTGIVREYDDPLGLAGVPRSEFSVLVLDRKNNEIVWESTSYNRGSDGVFFFDAGFQSTAAKLNCRMVRSVVERMTERPAPVDHSKRLLPKR